MKVQNCKGDIALKYVISPTYLRHFFLKKYNRKIRKHEKYQSNMLDFKRFSKPNENCQNQNLHENLSEHSFILHVRGETETLAMKTQNNFKISREPIRTR